MTGFGAPAPHDIFTDDERSGDFDERNRAALALHEHGGICLIERDGFRPMAGGMQAPADHPDQPARPQAGDPATMKTTFVGDTRRSRSATS